MNKFKKEIENSIFIADFPYVDDDLKPLLTIQNYANCLAFIDLFDAKYNHIETIGSIERNRIKLDKLNCQIKKGYSWYNSQQQNVLREYKKLLLKKYKNGIN